jgi:ribosome biogenesis GTPase / thiamine phosphate phosphatase
VPINDLLLKDLGWNPFFESQFSCLRQPGLVPARVVEERKGFHRVRTEQGEYLAEMAGRLRNQEEKPEHFPAVGDWVAITPRPEEGRARIKSILPRRTKLSRKVAGRKLIEQILATNLDTVFVVSALNLEFNVRRIERYLTIAWDSGARPVVLLNKADLCSDAASRAAEVEAIAPGTPVHLLSALAGTGLDAVRRYVGPGETAAFVGSSGVGKSTIINALAGSELLRVQPVREKDNRGRHTTTSRQMHFLPQGGIVIDTPGMRELRLWESEEGMSRAFEEIAVLAAECKFRNCRHNGEPGCAVETAIRDGLLQRERLENHRKLQAELRFQERKTDPEVARQDKEKWKKIHKAMRDKSSLF